MKIYFYILILGVPKELSFGRREQYTFYGIMLDYEGFEGPMYNLKTTPVENHQRDRYWISRFKGNVGIAKGLAEQCYYHS